MSSHNSGFFSGPARLDMIERYFDGRTIDPETAWKDVYRLLLWTDPTTGLAHCYESDKCQPGRPWYLRSLEFHRWLAEQFGVGVAELGDELDIMFKEAVERTTAAEPSVRERMSAKTITQRARYPDAMPLPGEDPELVQILAPVLDSALSHDSEMVREALRLARAHITIENKRKNLLGHGFEDLLEAIIRLLPGGAQIQVGTQALIQDIPGFREPRSDQKKEKVDLYVVTPSGRRVLVTAKWSVRSDREKQLEPDHRKYSDCNFGGPFDYVFVTNEFDPARMVANALASAGNHYLLNAVVHMCPEALRLVHELDAEEQRGKAAPQIPGLIDRGRIVGLGDWLRSLLD